MDFDVVNGIIMCLVNIFLTFVLLKLFLPLLADRYVSVLLILPVEVQEVELVYLEEAKRVQRVQHVRLTHVVYKALLLLCS